MKEFLLELADLLEKHDADLSSYTEYDGSSIEIAVGSKYATSAYIDSDSLREMAKDQ